MILPWILFVFAAIAAIIAFLGQNEPKKRLSEAEAKLREAETALETAKKQPLAAVAGGGPFPIVPPPPQPALDTNALADAEKRLNASLGEIKRLELAIAEAEAQVVAEREKVEVANSKATTAEAMAVQARSRNAEAGHAALLEAKQETDAVRAALADAEKRLSAVAAGEKKINDLVVAAQKADANAKTSAEQVKTLESEVSTLRTKLVQAEAAHAAMQKAQADAVRTAETTFAAKAKSQIADAEKVHADALQASEKTLREQYAIQLHKARTEWEQDSQARLAAEREQMETETRRLIAERERMEAETQRLTAELEQAKRVVVATPDPAPVAEDAGEPTLGMRRPRPAATKVSEITGEGSEKPLVILADSDANIQKTLTKHLEDGGYAVQTVATCADILTRARASQPAALAVDGANLPDGDCWKILTSLKEDAELKEIPVIVFAPGKDKERALEMGAAGCFAKPVDKAVLVATIKAAMVKRKQRARLAAVTGGANGAARRSSLLTAPSE